MEKLPAIGIELANRCNLANICNHCYGITGLSKKTKVVKISDKTLKMLIKEIPLIAKSVTITGGEPTTYPAEVNNFISKINLPWMLMTNGVIHRKDFHPKAVLVSLDPPDLRPGVDPKKVIRNVLRYRCNLSVNTVMSKKINLFSLYKILKNASVFLNKIDCHISEWKINFLVQRGSAVHHPEIFAKWDSVFRHLAKFLKIYFEEQSFPVAVKGSFFTKNINESDSGLKINFNSNPCLDCFHRGLYMTINANEKVQLCSMARNRVVSIKKGLINACLKIFQFPELRQMTYRDWKECQGCKWLRICGCGCPSLAEQSTGRWTEKDINQCEIMAMTEKYLLPIFPSEIKKAFNLK